MMLLYLLCGVRACVCVCVGGGGGGGVQDTLLICNRTIVFAINDKIALVII